MKNESLKDLAEKMRVTKRRAETDLEAVPYQTRSSMANMKRNAEGQLETLRKDFANAVRRASIAVFLAGDPARQEKFAEIAKKEVTGAMVVVHADAVYERLANRVQPSLGASRQFGVGQHQLLLGTLTDVEKELDIRWMSRPAPGSDRAIQGHEDLVGYIRSLIRTSVGDELTKVYVDRQIVDSAVSVEFAGSTLLVIVVGSDAAETAALSGLFTHANTIPVGTSEDGEVDTEFVLKYLAQTKKKLKLKQS